MLQLEQISWKSSAELLEKLIAYEAVHAIQSWSDLKNRLGSDRRCFAFFHPNMPNEPLIFVEVALVNGLADSVQQLLDEAVPALDTNTADTAIFYSISNAQQGLAGISFGNFLIKRVVTLLKQQLPQLKHFSTLSPIPGFCQWLYSTDAEQLGTLPGGQAWLNSPHFIEHGAHANPTPEQKQALQLALQSTLQSTLQQDQPQALAQEQQELQQALQSLAVHYLCQQKRNALYARDPVTHFHLSNGAQIARLNWMADSSGKGLQQSAGMMVNYLYELPKIESRSQQYTAAGKIALAAGLTKQLKRSRY